jgi:general stress protein 26
MKHETEDHYESLSGTKAVEQIRAVATSTRICFFGTALQRAPLTVRPMAVQSVDDAGNLWFLSGRSTHTNREISEDPQVQLLFSNPGSSEYLTLQGVATISADRALREEHWTPIAKTWFNGGVDDPELTVICVAPSDGYYWDTKHGKMVSFLKVAAGALTGKTIDDSIEGKVSL